MLGHEDLEDNPETNVKKSIVVPCPVFEIRQVAAIGHASRFEWRVIGPTSDDVLGIALAIGESLNWIKESTGVAVDLPDITAPLADVTGQVLDPLLGTITGRCANVPGADLAREIVVEVNLARARTRCIVLVAPNIKTERLTARTRGEFPLCL